MMKPAFQLASIATALLLLVAMTRADDAADEAAAKEVAIRFLVAASSGDGAAMQAETMHMDPAWANSVAERIFTARDLDAAERAIFRKELSPNPEWPRKPDELAQALRQKLNVQVDGDRAYIPQNVDFIFSLSPGMGLHKVNGKWLIDEASVFITPASVSQTSQGAIEKTHLFTRTLHIVADCNRQMIEEILAGKYRDLAAANAALKEKTQKAKWSDPEWVRLFQLPSHQPNTGAPDVELPKGATKSEMVGGGGGQPFVQVGSPIKPMIGFRYAMGDWMGRQVLRQLDPIFERSTVAKEDVAHAIMAKAGYVVGGLIVDTDWTNTVAVRVIFLRYKDGRTDTSVRYESDWIGIPSHKSVKTLAGNGQPVIGTFGQKGANLDAVGLVLGPSH